MTTKRRNTILILLAILALIAVTIYDLITITFQHG